MPDYSGCDGTRLAYREVGAGEPVVCLPGGPMLDSAYLADLGGLGWPARLVLVDHRGTGASATPDDPASYRCDRLVDDVEALRGHLGLERMTLLGHSAGTNTAVLYAARHPERIDRLILLTPSTRAVGITVTTADRREIVRRRAAEPWYGPAAEAFERINSGQARPDDWTAIAPFTYGRWDAAAREHYAAGEQRRNEAAAAVFGSDGAFQPAATRAALAALPVPVLLVAGELDANSPPRAVTEYAALFGDATLATQPGGGHFPWLDDPGWLTAAVTGFLR